MTAPFTDAYWTEVNLRVAYQLVKLDYKHNRAAYHTPHVGMCDLARKLRAGGFPIPATFILAASAYLAKRNIRYLEWHNSALKRAREGHSFRRVAFSEYKGTRGGDPRVTNRGVTVKAAPYAVHVERELGTDYE